MLRRARYHLAPKVARALSSLTGGRSHRPGQPSGPFGPPLESTRKLKELMTAYYLAGRYAEGAVPVAWVTSGFPVELLRPLGFHTVYPENHAAICGVKRLAPVLSAAAEEEGYSRDLCSYARTDLGSAFTGQTPVGRLPRPDLLCCCTNICQTVLYWYRALAERFRVPLVLIDTPYVYDEAPPHRLRYVRDQLEEAVRVAEEVARRRVEPEELREVTRLAREGSLLWGECLAKSQNRPAPWTGIDGFFHMAPIVSLRGTKECNAYYRMLRDELADRVQRGVGGIREERHRLLWDNLPIWFWIRPLATLLAEQGFNFVCTSYTSAWAEAGRRVDPLDPFGSAAVAYTHVILNEDLRHRLATLRRLAKEYRVDGAVLHSDRSCKPYSIGQVDLREILSEELGIRVLLLEADHSDPRSFAAEAGENRLLSFMEGFA